MPRCDFLTTYLALLLVPYTSRCIMHSQHRSGCRLVQWCHGAPAMLMTLAIMHQAFGSTGNHNFEQQIQRSADVVWQRGLLRKGVSLCHGVAGNGYALLSAHKATGQDAFLQQAQAFGHFAAQVRGLRTMCLTSIVSCMLRDLHARNAGAVPVWLCQAVTSNTHLRGAKDASGMRSKACTQPPVSSPRKSRAHHIVIHQAPASRHALHRRVHVCTGSKSLPDWCYTASAATVTDRRRLQNVTALPLGDRPSSLYEGLAGAVCFWADLAAPSQAHFPGYEMPPQRE